MQTRGEVSYREETEHDYNSYNDSICEFSHSLDNDMDLSPGGADMKSLTSDVSSLAIDNSSAAASIPGNLAVNLSDSWVSGVHKIAAGTDAGAGSGTTKALTHLPSSTSMSQQQQGVDGRAATCAMLLSGAHDKAIIDTVLRDVIKRDLEVTFDDIAALDTAKRLLNEAVVLPIIMPEFFTGLREPWRGVLLFGPPGTGKTLLAKAVAGLNASTFFSCSASSLISKYRGDSEKIVKCLFDAARLCAPSIIFLDEVDALVSSRGVDGEHEASRRFKTEFFSQMDGITSGKQSVMILCTTNCPWDLDGAMRRRLEKRIYIPLPELEARVAVFEICLKNIPVEDDVNVLELAVATSGYSGADIHLTCREASMMPMRRLLDSYSPTEIQSMRQIGLMDIPKVRFQDFRTAIENTKSSVSSENISRFEAWDREFGSK